MTNTTPVPTARPGRASAQRRQMRGSSAAGLLRWPIGLLAVLLAVAAWRGGGADDAARPADERRGPALQERSFRDARLTVPRSWITLDRSGTHVTWGDASRLHTVTLAATEASVLPLPGVVAALMRDSARVLPGATALGRPRPLQLATPAPRRDAAMLARFRVQDPSGANLDIAQVWRRDTRSGQDLVATWTSADGRWPVSPRRAIPRAPASR